MLVLTAALLWSGGGLGVKLLADVDAMSIAGYRSLFAFLAMGVAVAARGVRGERDDVARALKTPLVWAAAVSYAVMVDCFCVAAKLSTAANAIFLQYTAPIWVAFLSWPVLAERVRPRDWLTLGVAFGGMILFFVGKLEARGLAGNLVAMVSSFGFAGLPVLLRLEERKAVARGLRANPTSAVVATTVGNLIAAVAGAPWMLESTPSTTTGWTVLILLGTVQIALPYLLYSAAVRVLKALEASLFAILEPVVSPLWVFLVAGERPAPAALAGGGLIVIAVVLRAVFGR